MNPQEHNHGNTQPPPSAGSWVAVAIAWSAVAAPLAWGIWKTLEKAAGLFG